MAKSKKRVFSFDEEKLISEFRGLPYPAYYGKNKTVFSLEELITQSLNRYGIDGKPIEMIIMDNWKQIIGANKAHRCCPSRIIEGGTLVISVSNTILKSELTFECRQILRRIQEIEGCQSIKNIMLDVG